MKQIKFELGNLGVTVAVIILLSGGFFAGVKSVKKDACVLLK